MTDKGKVDTPVEESEALTQAVHKELIALRGAFGKLNLQKFSQYPTLREVSGGNDLTDDFLVFKRELERMVAESNRNEAAAALSILAPADLLLDRLEYVVEHFEDDSGEARDQRTGRRWSDRGMPNVATDLVRLARLAGLLGRESLNIELSGDPGHFFLSIWYRYSIELRAKPPQLNILDFSREDGPKDQIVDLDRYRTMDREDDGFRAQQYHVPITLPDNLTHPDITGTETVVTMALRTKWAPMRTMLFVDKSDLGRELRAVYSAHRGLIMIHLMHGEPKSKVIGVEVAPPSE
ncbi:MAG: hypothetical protein M9953_11055 [Thermomicrobiales bacterium]|nr:hypothetical protein [Thermomicrobiales bacterium]MCO5219177.1 hypothetical protein [Thermomicrobiales bacterium]MCO5225865.1 hypothetical protein [Thermomicrobiales bacterium]MCO5228065.1 hypothetical protein [Thermomicrobiales bacterium]